MEDIQEIVNSMESTPDDENSAILEKAFKFAANAHQGQKRYSGEPYLIHCLETAKILAGLGMSTTTVAAGLLHDTLEDAGIERSVLEKEFGKEIVFLVDGVTKLGKLKYHGVDRHNESLRKLFIAMSEDLRVLIIKLADRLHNMRTLKYVPEHKQKRIARETLEIYAPIAYRLGIRRLNRELEDLAFPYIYPQEYEWVTSLLKERNKEILNRLEKFQRSIQKALAKEGETKIHTDFRLKGLYSLYQKLLRKDKDIEKIYDIAALRIIVPTVEDCYKVLGIIHKIWRPLIGRIKDYIAVPKPNGYRSIHTTIFTGDGGIVEVQIKTEEMYREAEYGVASHLSYKGGLREKAIPNLNWVLNLIPFRKNGNSENNGNAKKADLTDVPVWIKDLVEYQAGNSFTQELTRGLKTDFLAYRMFIFTPKGDVIDLPVNSTPIDFAYAIHSDIGDHVAAVKVNGKLMPISTKLQNGDNVEILTKTASHPTEKWLAHAKTTAAKKRIQLFLENLKKKA